MVLGKKGHFPLSLPRLSCVLALKTEPGRGCCHLLPDPIPGASLADTGAAAAYLPQVCQVLCQHRCFHPHGATWPSTAQEPFWDGCQRGVGLCSPHSRPAIAHPCCKEKTRGCVLGKGRWRQRGSKPGTTQHRSLPVCFLEDGAGGLSSLGGALEVSPCLKWHWRTQRLVCKYSV